jgi:outer membrane protein assembly factor BamB
VILQVDQAKDSFLAAYDLASGRQLWRTPRPELPSWATPVVVEGDKGPEIVCHGGHAIRGYDPETGRERWHLEPTAEVTVGSPVAAHGLVYVANGYRPVQPVYAIRPGGSGDISLAAGSTAGERVAWSQPKGGTYIPTPIVIGDHLYTLADNGTLTCYDAKTGEQIYKQRVGAGRAAFTASPVAADGRLYLSSEDGDVFVVKAGRDYQSLETNSLGEVIMATPALSGDLLIVRTQGHVWGLREGVEPPRSGAGEPAPRQ